MTIRRLIALAATAGMVLMLVACGGGSKSGATKTPAKRTPGATRTVAPRTTGTPSAATTSPSSQDGGNDGGGSPPPTNIPRPSPISGDHFSFRVTFTLAADPGNLQPLVEGRNRLPTRLAVTIGSGVFAIEAPGRFIRVQGAIDAAGNATGTGTGTIDQFRNVEATFTGIIANGRVNGTYAFGTNGTLPGRQPISYSVTGTAQSDHTPAATQTQ